MTKPNIGIAGGMYAGKTTLADALVEQGYVRLSFAGPLKNVAALAYGPIDKGANYETVTNQYNNMDGNITVKENKSGRQILQDVGQHMKNVDRDFWIKAFMRDVARYEGTPLVVDDLRFMFEMEHLRNNGWFIVGVSTPLEDRMERAERITGRRPTDAELNHESEREVPAILMAADYRISGTGDPYVEVTQIMARYNAYTRPR